ncbi:MAG: hypothetical protein ACFFHD_13170 [Promethearchaeota archaeon]
MPNTNFTSQKKIPIDYLNKLISKYEKKAECGIFFTLNDDKSPLDIIGVLNFLKYKIKKWGNTNLFTYIGKLFEDNTILVVGARDIEEAKSIIIYMFLSNFLSKNKKIDDFLENQGFYNDLEQFLNTEFAKNIKTGYPIAPHLENQLKQHLKKLIIS